MENKRLDNAALAAGISPSYINAHGQPQSIAAATKQRLLGGMHRNSSGPERFLGIVLLLPRKRQ